jgi:FkbM family methyltransferase
MLSENYIFEKEVRDAITLILKFVKISKFWDVGGNIGYYSFLISSLLPKSEIVAFEPFGKNIDLFKRTIKDNRITNIKLIGKAVSNKTGFDEFWLMT